MHVYVSLSDDADLLAILTILFLVVSLLTLSSVCSISHLLAAPRLLS